MTSFSMMIGCQKNSSFKSILKTWSLLRTDLNPRCWGQIICEWKSRWKNIWTCFTVEATNMVVLNFNVITLLGGHKTVNAFLPELATSDSTIPSRIHNFESWTFKASNWKKSISRNNFFDHLPFLVGILAFWPPGLGSYSMSVSNYLSGDLVVR